jgi:hypothetical protein
MIAGQAVPLRVVYCTHDLEHLSLNTPAYALAYTLRDHGDACLVGVGRMPLPEMEVAEAQRFGIEHVFLPLVTRDASALAIWRTFLERFRPDIVHFSQDIDLRLAKKLANALDLMQQAIVVFEDLHASPHLPSRQEAIWHPMLHLPETTLHPAVPISQRYAARTGANGAAQDAAPEMDGMASEMASMYGHGRVLVGVQEKTPLAFVGLAEPTDLLAVTSLIQAFGPLIERHEMARCVLLVDAKLISMCNLLTAPRLRSHIALISDERIWQREALSAIGAIGHTLISYDLLGAALALNRPVIVADARLAQTPVVQAPAVRWVAPEDEAAFVHQVSMLIDRHLAFACAPPQTPTTLELARQRRWMYFGLKFRATCAQKGQKTG